MDIVYTINCSYFGFLAEEKKIHDHSGECSVSNGQCCDCERRNFKNIYPVLLSSWEQKGVFNFCGADSLRFGDWMKGIEELKCFCPSV